MARQVAGELFRFGIVGLLSNGVLYVAYIALTSVGLGPKASMTITFMAGVLQTFMANRSFTFRTQKARRGVFVRYFATYGLAYMLNLLVLLLLVDIMGFSHVVIQGIAILALAMLIFILQKYWVFKAYKER